VIDLRALSVEESRHDEPADRAAVLRRACGHARAGAAVLDAGYRFFPMRGGDVPHFLNRRFTCSDGRAGSITLIAGIDPATGEAPLDGCRTMSDARAALERVGAATFLVRVTLGNDSIDWPELATSLSRNDPAAFDAISSGLLALPLATRRACEVCAA
jgi:hypothetical protein